MVPKDIQAWYAGAPWYWNGKPPSSSSKNGRQPFEYETDMQLHELAHLIQCFDKDTFDPLWGQGEAESSVWSELTAEQVKQKLK